MRILILFTCLLFTGTSFADVGNGSHLRPRQKPKIKKFGCDTDRLNRQIDGIQGFMKDVCKQNISCRNQKSRELEKKLKELERCEAPISEQQNNDDINVADIPTTEAS